MHHRRAGSQVGKLLDDSRGVAVGPTPASFLAGAFAEQLLFGVQRDRRFGQCQARSERGDGQRDGCIAGEEILPAGNHSCRHAVRAQQVQQQLASSRGLGGQQHAALVVCQPRCEVLDRLLVPLVKSHCRCFRGAQVQDRHLVAVVGRAAVAGRIGAAACIAVADRAVVSVAEQQPRRARQCRLPFRGWQENFAGGEHWVLDVVPAFLESFLHRGPGRGEDRWVFSRQRDDRAGGQVVEQARRLVEEQWQVVLDAGRGQTFAHVAVERHACQVAFEARPEAASESTHRFRPKTELAGREQVDARQVLTGALCLGVEAAHALHPQVHQVDAQRNLAAHREHVEQRAADGEFTWSADLGHACISGRSEPQPERGEVEFLADVDG